MNHPRERFQPKMVGIGWTPRTWEGCAIIVAVVAIRAVLGRMNTGTSGVRRRRGATNQA